MTHTNKFCALADLVNEASVESCFIDPLLKALKYPNNEIARKTSISELAVGKGRQKVLYRPDYVLKVQGIPNIVVDAKAPSENIEDWETQCSSYALEINKQFDYNPVQYFLLSNGLKTNLYRWDVRTPVLQLNFEDFAQGNPKYHALCELIGYKEIQRKASELRDEIDNAPFPFEKVGQTELNIKFQKLHRAIWKAEKKSPSAAFVELMKIVFVKIKKDTQIHALLGDDPLPKYRDVIFSSHWVSSQTEEESPVNDPLFKNLVNELEKEIAQGRKKRIFEPGEQINLSAETIKKVVKEIEHIDFYSMEEDIHGRMFESFLDATIRGKDIGQFFTPRDIVNLMVELADIQVSKDENDSVLDACCGSGGFLIAAMGSMLSRASNLKGLSSRERETVVNRIKNKSIFGIDAGSDPSMYKIARMNMYLHGDGGSNIFYADSLDKGIGKVGRSTIEVDEQLDELRRLIITSGKQFDVILSNPPFSMEYTRDDAQQAAILNQYQISVDRIQGKILNKLLSSVMFLERYKDLVSERGTIFAIVDDSVLSGESYRHVREFIRTRFVIIGVVSLPGDAFKRASARVKTSIIVLRPQVLDEEQGDVFMTSSVYLGLEEKTARRIGIDPRRLKGYKEAEMERIGSDFKNFKKGINGDYVVPAERLKDRLDVKYCVADRGRRKGFWNAEGLKITSLGKVLLEQNDRGFTLEDESGYQLLRVTYHGDVIDGDFVEGSESSYHKLYEVKTWDILVSNIGFGRGAIGIVPPFHDAKVVSNEYTILRAATKEEAVYYSNLLRTKEILGDVLSSTTGMNRGRIKWDEIRNIEVPEYDSRTSSEIASLVREMEAFWHSYKVFISTRKLHTDTVSSTLRVNEEDSQLRWLSFKPPE